MSGKTIQTINGVTVIENTVDDNNLAITTLESLGWDLGPVGGDHESIVSLMFVMKGGTTLGTIYANPRFLVRASGPTKEFIRQARRAQRAWLREMKSVLGSSGRLRQAIAQRHPMLRQLEFTGVLVVEGKHVAPSHWPSINVVVRHAMNLDGQVFGRLIAVKQIGFGQWLCQCKCGNTTTVRAKHLVNGKTQSCGCLKAECEARQQLRKLSRA